LTVPDEGHAPSLEGRLIQSISQFILEVEASA
jgi:hypothetical protein